ncbi:SDR family oxidoreductase [Solirubrobacter taibaiensis]|nr:SDR family oxidoreductase [Solirubrobacter taibaiensis]
MDKVMVIAGASSGIGAATARQAAAAGYRVVLGARSEDKLRQLAEETGGIAVKCDVAEYAQVEALAQRALAEYGRIDVVFANAGVGHPRGFEAGDPDDAKQMVITNVFGIYATIRATAKALRDTQGHLVITSSIAGRRALKGSLYSATKFAVTGMAEAARQDFNGTGVRTTLISPGMVETPGFSHPQDDVLNADDIARAVLFAVEQPPHMDVNEILIRPTAQDS